MDLEKQLLENELRLKKERAELDRLAEESLRLGNSLSDQPKVFEQAHVVDGLVLKEIELQKMLEECEKAETAQE